MWRDYSVSFVKKNRASSISVMVSCLVASLFLSLLCSLFYNLWIYDIETIVLEEGDWQGRIAGEFDEDDLNIVRNFANVDRIVVSEKLSSIRGNIAMPDNSLDTQKEDKVSAIMSDVQKEELLDEALTDVQEKMTIEDSVSNDQEIVLDIYFTNMRTIYQDMPLIVEKLGLKGNAASYHELLLSRYLIHDPQDENPPLLLTFYLFILMIVSLSLILIIHNSFAVSMDARIHQFGILSSIGTTPGQIRTCLMQEAAVLSIVPILLGTSTGIVLSCGMMRAVNLFAADVFGRHEAVFQYRLWIFAITIVVSAVTVLISAWLPARKLGRLTPLQAIRDTGGLQLEMKKHSRILSSMFGIEGELAGNALKAQRKALRTSTLSLTLSFLGFTVMLCFLTLSDISTNHTYFERYQDAWDVMVTVGNTKIEDFVQTDALRNLPGVQSSVVYQKATATVFVPEADISEDLRAIGGLEAVTGSMTMAEGNYVVQAPIIIMDDAGFAEYCVQLGIEPQLGGVIVLNRIWDSVNSNFRYKKYVPFVKESRDVERFENTMVQNSTMEIPVTAYTQETPLLREEYDDCALVQFIPLSLWERLSGRIGDTETDTYIRILGKEGMTLAEIDALEMGVSRIVNRDNTAESENRIREKITNDSMMRGFMLVIGAFCALLAVIGIANVFSNTLGFLRQRKREFAQYMSVGMTVRGMRKMFCIEALVIAGRPLAVTLPLTVAATGFMITVSYLDPMEFLVKAPIVPIAVFILTIFVFVAVAYYIGGKRILNCNLTDALRNDGIE